MKLVITNFKGGVGKTSIAIALASLLELPIVTNDSWSPLQDLMPEGTFKKIEAEKDIPLLDNTIYDLGGYADNRALPVIKEADYVIVPIINTYLNNKGSVNTISNILPYNKNIIVIVNQATDKDFEFVKLNLNSIFNSIKIKTFLLKKTTAFDKMFLTEKTIEAIIESDKTLARPYKIVATQLKEIADYINNTKENRKEDK
jgi:cellulose biosynthesis protein BcsQ